jgi:hypothetical protein
VRATLHPAAIFVGPAAVDPVDANNRVIRY